jgi:hypothetical protein
MKKKTPPESSRAGAEAQGLSVFDLLDLSRSQTSVLRLIMRKVAVSLPDLHKAAQALPERERLSPAEADQVLGELLAQKYIIRTERAGQHVYRVQSRRRSARDLTRVPRRIAGGVTFQDISNILSDIPDSSRYWKRGSLCGQPRRHPPCPRCRPGLGWPPC